MASIATFISELASMTVTGVTRQYVYPPNQLSTADLPASFVTLPTAVNETIATCDEVSDTFTAELVIALEPTGQNLQPTNYAAVLAMMDNVNAALKATDFTDLLQASWQLSTPPTVIGASAYWSVTATVTAQGSN